jgi:hypothetical protein
VNQNKFLVLCRLAREVYSIPPTSFTVERAPCKAVGGRGSGGGTGELAAL